MPNNVTNTLVIAVYEGDYEERLREILAEIKGECECIDFETIVPESGACKASYDWDPTSGTKQDLTWYDEHVERWGTKWNAYGQSMEDPSYGEVTITFDTAWTAPFPIIAALREKYPDASFYGSWVEEGHQSAGVF